MSRARISALAATLAAASSLAAAAPAGAMASTETAGPKLPADLLLTDGHVKTPTGWASALAIRAGIIEAVGDEAGMAGLRGPKTQIVDLHGRTVLPGLHDVHVHPVYGGVRERDCKIPQGSSLKETLAQVAACVRKAAPHAWIVGGQWDAPALGEIPNRAMLDAIAPDNPVYLEDTSGHSVWVNSRMLAAAGIGKATSDPKGGIFERDAAGEPTGVAREAAMDLLGSFVPKPSEAELQSALSWSLERMLSYGITSFTEAAVGFTAGARPELEAYAALADKGVLKQRVRLCLVWSPDNPESEPVIASRNFYAREKLRPDCVKIFLDGVPTDSHTAAMLEPYQGSVGQRDDAASKQGMLLVKPEVLNAAVTRFDRIGLTVKFHAAGDAAVHEALDAIAAARAANGFSAQMHNAGHCTFVAPADIARARSIQAVFEVSPYLWGPTPINDSITQAVGPEVIKRVWPVREMLAAGALVVPGSDWSVVPSVDPWIGIETLVTRERPGGSKESFGKDEAITLAQAIDLFTVNSAAEEGRSSEIGALVPGLLADLIVVDRDPYAVPATQLHATEVELTLIGGKIAFDRAAARPAP
jgi:hypothetical protein